VFRLAIVVAPYSKGRIDDSVKYRTITLSTRITVATFACIVNSVFFVENTTLAEKALYEIE